jgi:hypothetical protein
MRISIRTVLVCLFCVARLWAAAEKPQEIAVGVYVLNVGKFELSTGQYTMDFYLSLTSDRPIADNSFEFMNGRASSFELLSNEPTNKFYRIQANLYANLSVKAYPFDSHALSIQLEDKTNSIHKVRYKDDPANSGIDPEVTIVGWDLTGSGSAVAHHEYKTFNETYSKYIYAVNIQRIVLTSIMKAFLPAFFLVLVGLLALLLKPDKFAPRLGLNTSTLLGAVMFHLNVTSQIPPVGYLTFADKFMIVSYISLIACLISTIVLMRHTDKGDEASATRIYRLSLQTIPLLTLVLYAVTFLVRG